jgi:DtxR family transcriptional regulator, Mn-dependent transcriptional regulator
VHEEACRWEHVMSDRVERKILTMLDHPTESPYGNPIPGLAELGEVDLPGTFLARDLQTLPLAAGSNPTTVVVRRIGEPAQQSPSGLATLALAGIHPGKSIQVRAVGEQILVLVGTEEVEIARLIADHVLVGPTEPSAASATVVPQGKGDTPAVVGAS